MSFEITVNIPALDRLVDALNANVDVITAINAAEIPAAKPKAEKPAAKAKAAPVEAEAEDTAAPEAEEGVTLDDLKEAAIHLSSKNGRDALAAALKGMGATAGVSTIPEDKRAAFVAHCKAAAA